MGFWGLLVLTSPGLTTLRSRLRHTRSYPCALGLSTAKVVIKPGDLGFSSRAMHDGHGIDLPTRSSI